MGTQHDSPGLVDEQVHVEMESAAQLPDLVQSAWTACPLAWHARSETIGSARKVPVTRSIEACQTKMGVE
jgi:hypothetical protein